MTLANNLDEYLFNSELMYPPIIASGTVTCALGDYDKKVLFNNMLDDYQYGVFEQRIIGNTNEPIISPAVGATYIEANRDLVTFPTFTPSTLIWRVYGY